MWDFQLLEEPITYLCLLPSFLNEKRVESKIEVKHYRLTNHFIIICNKKNLQESLLYANLLGIYIDIKTEGKSKYIAIFGLIKCQLN